MELKQIQYFETTCRRKSFSKAAEELLVTQQAVSKVIQKLEQELGVKLFVRAPKGVILTEDGRYFQEQAAIILQTQNDIINHFTAIRNQTKNSMRIGVSHGLGYFFGEKCFLGFKQKYPETELRIMELWNSQIEENVHNGTLDAGFTIAPTKYPELCTELILKEPLYCILDKNHPLADRTSLAIDDILDQKIVMADENFNSYHNFQKKCSERDKKPKTVQTSDLLHVYEHVMNSDSIGFTLKSYTDIIHFQNIKNIPLDDPDAYWDICLVYRQSSKMDMIEKFVKYIKEFCRT